jgi:hypothetical protein
VSKALATRSGRWVALRERLNAPIDAFSANRRPAVGSGPGAPPDGSGGADPADGTGLTGLLDRIEARDGTLTITSPPGLGTTLHATLPLRDMES